MKIREFQPGDESAAYHVCLKTGDHGGDGEPYFRDDPDALGRIYVGPYLQFSPDFALMLEDGQGICGYSLGTLDSRAFYRRYDLEWRPQLVQQFADPPGDESHMTRLESVYHTYHHPDYFCPEPYNEYPAHLHIDLLPRAQGQGCGRRMMEELLQRMAKAGAVGVHLGMSASNDRAHGFYLQLGFHELARDDESIYMGKKLSDFIQ